MQFKYLNTSYVIENISKESYPSIESTIFKFLDFIHSLLHVHQLSIIFYRILSIL